jgi:hypothetical protein
LHGIKKYSNLDIDPFHDACREIKVARDAVSIAEKEAQAYLAKDDFSEGDLPHLITLDLAFSALKKAVEKTMAAAATSLSDRSKYSQELASTALAPMREVYQAQDTLFATSLKKSISVREIPLSSLEFQKKALESAIHSTEQAVRYGEDYINNFLELENDEAAQIFVLTESDSSSAHIHQLEEAESKLKAAKATAVIAIENAKDHLEQHITSDDITINLLDKDVLFEALNITAAALSKSTYQVKCALKNVEKYRHLYPDDVEKIITKMQQLDIGHGITSDIIK